MWSYNHTAEGNQMGPTLSLRGIDNTAYYKLWQTLTLMAILFHHANIRLPIKVERWLCRLVMTPRMHGMHHSIVQEEANANWSTILA